MNPADGEGHADRDEGVCRGDRGHDSTFSSFESDRFVPTAAGVHSCHLPPGQGYDCAFLS